MDIRPARPEDLPRLQAIEVAAGSLFRDAGLPEVAEHPPPPVEELAASAGLLVAVDEEDRPVGYARMELVDGHTHLEQLSVDPAHGRRGIGTELLAAVERWARARGDVEVTLTTFRDVEFNAPLYARRGYRPLAEEERGPELVEVMAHEAAHGLDPEARVAMRRDLSS